MFCISVVTFNRREVLQRTLGVIYETTRFEAAHEGVNIFVSDNGSTDGTVELLANLQEYGRITAYWPLPVNLGTSGGRNAHWAECVGRDSVRMDDKVLPRSSRWLTIMKRQADQRHAIVATPYDPVVQWMQALAPAIDFMPYPQEAGQGGPFIFLPGALTEALGAVDELDDCKYGWDDCLYIKRAELLGWAFGFTLRVPVTYLTQASPERRAKALEYHAVYLERLRQYTEAERDLFQPVEDSGGYAAGRAVREHLNE